MAPRQTWDPEDYSQNARFVADLARGVVELLAPQKGERILDLGCGDGHLTAQLAAMGCRVLGVDSSAAQVEAARRRGVDAHVAAAEALPFKEEFDAVFSNATLHWVKAADDAIASVHRALVPGGRFVAELGGEACLLEVRGEIKRALGRRGLSYEELDPWIFPSASEYRSRLEGKGFEVGEIRVFPRPTVLPRDMITWLRTFAQAFTLAVTPEDRGTFLEEVQEALRPRLLGADGRWTADYTRLRFKAVKKAL